MFPLYKIIFFNSMIAGTLISISSYSWMSMWMGLEINLLSIIPLMNNAKNVYSTEASIKYFLTQVLASLILLFSIIMLLLSNEFITPLVNQSLMMIMNSSLLTKLGAAPFHFWFPEVMEGLNWMNCLILLTWQKIAPMILIMNNKCTPFFLMVIIITSIFISGVSALNQISLRKIMTFSSINHIGWMLTATLVGHSVWTLYFLIYTFLTLNMVLIFSWTKTYFIKQLSNSMNENKLVKFTIMLNFLSLGGLPPFLGFLPKWMIVNLLSYGQMFFLAVTMIILTLLSLFIYVRLMFFSMILLNIETKIKLTSKKQTKPIALMLVTSLLIVFGTLILNSI
uniref:NADH-ubiquinone oxidoreductase chain 2 n=1 Tax=Tenebrionoidea sp. 18 KM-2017 TaxID=2219473 RepID=A0A346RHJ4_9CUCU|nr:NADH dehydrogenase subunit 2 [Tenebrionoidea sp. 18 KM-2017]